MITGGVVAAVGLISGTIALALWLQIRSDNKHNAYQYAIYNRMAEKIANGLSSEEMSYDQYVILINTLREVFNENLRGWNAQKLKLPRMSVSSTKPTPRPTYRGRPTRSVDGH